MMTIIVVPVLLLFLILYVCKKYNFSILPNGMKGKKPSIFKFPNIYKESKKDDYKWNKD